MNRRNFLSIIGTSFTVASGVVPQIAQAEKETIKLTPRMEYDTRVWRDSENRVHRMEFSDGTIVGYEKNIMWTQYPNQTKFWFYGKRAYQFSDIAGVVSSL